MHAEQYRPLVVAYNKENGAAVRLEDVADVQDSVEDAHIYGLSDGKPAVLLIIFRQPGANIIQTVDNVLSLLPQLEAAISPAIKLTIVSDRTTTVRASLRDIEITLAHLGRSGHLCRLRLSAHGACDHHPQHRGATLADWHLRSDVPPAL